jgi:hypothetical protein
MAAFLFVDIVGFSRGNGYLLPEVMQHLNDKCREELKSIQSNLLTTLRVISVPTGDGAFICLDRTSGRVSENLGWILLELAFNLQGWGRGLQSQLKGLAEGIQFRIGLHEGTVHDVTDMNGLPNATGTDIIDTQRIMDCGKAGHILCSAKAHSEFFRKPASGITFDEIQHPYKDKHGGRIFIFNVTKHANGQLINGNETTPPFRVSPRMSLFPFAKGLQEFSGVKHLTVVGVTNDQMAKMLSDGSAAGQPHTIESLDVCYPMDFVYEHLPQYEDSLHYPGAVKGRKRRSLRRCKEEKRRSIKRLKALSSKDVRVRLLEHPFCPAAAIVARDFKDRKRGMIETTHYIWGWKAGSCPTVVWRASPTNPVYDLYRDHLKLLMKKSKVLYDSQGAP